MNTVIQKLESSPRMLFQDDAALALFVADSIITLDSLAL